MRSSAFIRYNYIHIHDQHIDINMLINYYPINFGYVQSIKLPVRNRIKDVSDMRSTACNEEEKLSRQVYVCK